MAPRRQARQAAAESVVAAAADGNVTPPKKRKTAAKSAATNFTADPKQVKGRSRQAKVDKQENEVVREPVSPLKKSRGRQKNAAGATAATTTAKNDTKSKPEKRVNKEVEDATVENNDAHEEIIEKKARGKAAMKKAEIKVTVMKSKAKVPTARKQNTRTTVENNAENLEKQNVVDERPVKRTTRRMKAIEESDVPIQPAAKVSRKRKNIEDTNEAIIEAPIIEKEEKEEEDKEEKEAKVDGKKLRGKPKKMESYIPIVTSKGRSKKNPARELSPLAKSSPKEAEIKKQNAMIQEDNPKTKNMKNAKKGNAKNAALKRKFDAVAEMINDVQAEEAAIPEVDVKENGEVHMTESKQKKRNAKRANMAVNGKAKGKQKKGGAASVNETEKDVTTENEITETNVASEIDGNDTKDVSLNKDDSVLEIKKEDNEIDDSKPNSMKNDITSDAETSINETERLGTFLCF